MNKYSRGFSNPRDSKRPSIENGAGESEILNVQCQACGERSFYRFKKAKNQDWMCINPNCDMFLRSTETPLDLPQKSEDTIYFYLKDGAYGWLSNFWPSKFIGEDNLPYETVEHYYQSRKTLDPLVREWIRSAPKPYLAMKAGRNLRYKDRLAPDWDQYKHIVMLNALRWKFQQNSELREKLIATGEVRLEEDSPDDMYWGRLGENMLGNLLRKVRNELNEMEPMKCPECGIVTFHFRYLLTEDEKTRGYRTAYCLGCGCVTKVGF
jgi:hypothetical protein